MGRLSHPLRHNGDPAWSAQLARAEKAQVAKDAVQGSPRSREALRAAEPATVVGLTYRILDDEHNEDDEDDEDMRRSTVAVLMLKLLDDSSPLRGREFDVELPPPHHGHPEFVFLKSRFDSAVKRRWKVGDRCQVRS